MADIFDAISEALSRVEAEGRKPARLLIGNREAAELEAALYRPARPARREMIGGRLFTWEEAEEEYAPKLTLDMAPASIFDVPVKRVDQPTLLGVVAEGFE